MISSSNNTPLSFSPPFPLNRGRRAVEERQNAGENNASGIDGKGMKGKRWEQQSATEKEKTKLQKRLRQSITTKIFNGLRKHDNYNLPPHVDINGVLRALATEASFIVKANGTTYKPLFNIFRRRWVSAVEPFVRSFRSHEGFYSLCSFLLPFNFILTVVVIL